MMTLGICCCLSCPGIWGVFFDKVQTWLEAADTPADAEFNYWWLEWVRMENTGYERVEDKEEADEAEEYPNVVRIRNEEKWRRRNLLETKYDLLQQWLRDDEGMVHMYDLFVGHFVTLAGFSVPF